MGMLIFISEKPKKVKNETVKLITMSEIIVRLTDGAPNQARPVHPLTQ